MANVFDVAAHILHKNGAMSSMKLQKLAYYSQAWSLVWDEKPLFEEQIQAWANGPVIPALFKAHKGEFMVSKEKNGDRRKLLKIQRETIDAVLKHYGKKTGRWLSALTHSEDPWRDARKGLKPSERGTQVISNGALSDFYGNL